jgi:uncharacterized protein YbjT (DUF2867 family)
MHPILVTGASGRTGNAVARQLLEAGYAVRTVVHRHDERSDALHLLGADVVVADLFDFEQLSDAMRGVRRAYYCPPFHPYMIHSAAAFAAAARDAKLESIVGLSQWLANPSHPSLSTRHHWLADRIFGMIPDVSLTIVNPGFFADYPYMALMPYVALLGVFPMPIDGESRNAPPSAEDIARVCVGALIDPDKHAGKTYRPTGPVSLSINEMTAIMSRVVGRKVRHVKLPMWMFYKAARLDGTDLHLLSSFPHYTHEQDAGAFAFGAPTNHVLEVTGRQPEDFETIARRYAALPQSRRTFGNTLKALAKFASVPLRPGLDPQRYEMAHDFPRPPAPRYDMDSERWKMEHASADAAASILLSAVRSSGASSRTGS